MSLPAEAAVIAVFPLLVGVGIVKGTLGFGSGLLSVPIVVQAFPPETAIAALTLPLWLGNVPVLVADGVPWGTLRRERWLVLLAAAGTVVGLLALAAVPAGVVPPLIGGYLVVYLLGRRAGGVRDRLPKRGLGPLAGAAGGFVHGAVLSGGPVFISYFHATQSDTDRFATTLTAIFFLAMTIRLVGLYGLGRLGRSTLALGVAFLLPLWLGVYGGTRLRPRVPGRRFEVLVEVLLAVIAVRLLSGV